jgi:predicted transcriptional regulator of viral defense system
MRYDELLDVAGWLPVVDTESLRVLGHDPGALSVQISRWVGSGRLIRLRRGLYLLPERYRRCPVGREYLANLVQTPSYVSLERALSIHQMIPEAVPTVQSVSTGRTAIFETPVGEFRYRHVKTGWFGGYREMQVGQSRALVATMEKALLDLVYLSRGEFTMERIEGLRLQELDALDTEALMRLAGRAGSGRVMRAARRLVEHVSDERWVA